MSVDYDALINELTMQARNYCKIHGLDVNKLAQRPWCYSPDSITYAEPNPNAQPELGMGDDANLPFPTLIVYKYGGWRGEPIRYEVKETPFTRKYLV